MKKICITLVAAATFFTLSCKKEDNQPSNNNKPNSDISEADAKLERSLQNFISKVKNYNTNNAKTRTASDAYSLDSTEFYLEAALNYDHRYIPTDYDKEYSNETTFSILKNVDGTVDFSNIANAFTNMNNGVNNFLNSIAESDKDMVYADLIRKEINAGTLVEYTLRTGYVGKTASNTWTLVGNKQNPFVVGWFYGNYLGNENGQFGANSNLNDKYGWKDATTELTRYCNLRAQGVRFNVYYDGAYPDNIAISALPSYVTNVNKVTQLTVYSQGVASAPGSIYPYRLFTRTNAINNNNILIPANYMNFFYHQALLIVQNNLDCQQQTNLGKAALNFKYKVARDPNSSGFDYHALDILFGNVHGTQMSTQ